jgi:hypothetical protein
VVRGSKDSPCCQHSTRPGLPSQCGAMVVDHHAALLIGFLIIAAVHQPHIKPIGNNKNRISKTPTITTIHFNVP